MTTRQATSAAVWGGTTTVVDFAIPRPGQRPLDAVQERQAAAAAGVCDAALHGCAVSWDDTMPAQLRAMAALGVRTIKLFTTYRDVVMADPGTIAQVMVALKEHGGLAYVHAEDNVLIERAQHQAEQSQRLDAAGHPQTRPEAAELAAVRMVLDCAQRAGAPVYFVHQSTPEAIDAVRTARDRGVLAYTETCPHYLALNAGRYTGPHPERYVCCPPLRAAATVQAVVRRALDGQVDTIGSDHCCYDTTQKLADRHDVRIMPNGMPGVETRMAVVYTELVQRRGLALQRFVALTSTNPARLNGIHPRKGVIAPGADADLVLLDPHTPRTVHAQNLHTATDYSPYEDQTLTGWPHTVLVAGRVVIDNGETTGVTGTGRALPADRLDQHRLLC